MAEVVWRFRNE